jgi:hypothetical protein
MISPEPFIQKCRSLAHGKNPHLDVAHRRIRLAWTVGSTDSYLEFMERTDLIGLGISYDMLLDALIEAGGALDADGQYPIDDAIRRTLRKFWKC